MPLTGRSGCSNSAHPTGGTYKAKSRGAFTAVPVPTGLFPSMSQTHEAWAILSNLRIEGMAAENGPRLGVADDLMTGDNRRGSFLYGSVDDVTACGLLCGYRLYILFYLSEG